MVVQGMSRFSGLTEFPEFSLTFPVFYFPFSSIFEGMFYGFN